MTIHLIVGTDRPTVCCDRTMFELKGEPTTYDAEIATCNGATLIGAERDRQAMVWPTVAVPESVMPVHGPSQRIIADMLDDWWGRLTPGQRQSVHNIVVAETTPRPVVDVLSVDTAPQGIPIEVDVNRTDDEYNGPGIVHDDGTVQTLDQFVNGEPGVAEEPCPDCGDDPDDPTLHKDGCPRIGTDAEYQCGPPWKPLPGGVELSIPDSWKPRPLQLEQDDE